MVAALARLVAFNEIPQRELRDESHYIEVVGGKLYGCIQRNPTKGIESFMIHHIRLLTYPFQLHSTKSHKGN